LNWGINDLQSSALPLGYAAFEGFYKLVKIKKTHKYFFSVAKKIIIIKAYNL
jgi:hypothetical protein